MYTVNREAIDMLLFLFYFLSVLVLSGAGWVYSRRVQSPIRRIFFRSGIIGFILSPLKIMLLYTLTESLVYVGPVGSMPEFIAMAFYMEGLPIIILWAVVFMVWISIFELGPIWKGIELLLLKSTHELHRKWKSFLG